MVDTLLGTWGPGNALKIYPPSAAASDRDDDGDGCGLRASSQLLPFADEGDLILTTASPEYLELRVYEMLFGEHGAAEPRWPVVWAFNYRPNRARALGSCYLQSAVGAEAVGYFVDQGEGSGPDSPLGLYLPDQFGATFFQLGMGKQDLSGHEARAQHEKQKLRDMVLPPMVVSAWP